MASRNDERMIVCEHAYHVLIRFSIQSMREHRHHEQVDDEAADERNARLNKIIVVCFRDGPFALSVDASTLHQRRMQIQIVRHDHGADDADRLQEFLVAAVCAPWNEHPFGNVHHFRFRNNKLKQQHQK